MNLPERKKLNGENDSHKCSRSLNDFHDATLKHILSFLPTRVAAKTSVLSKRWQYMWTSLPNLVFEGYTMKERKQFMNFVDRALVLHDASLIRKFSLGCFVEDESDDIARIKLWISGAVRRNAQEFDICFRATFDNLYKLPFCLFSCEMMEVLKLDIFCSVQLPSQICLPRLKTLALINITFKDYHPTNLLFASPALEELFIEHCTWEGDNNEVIISAPMLRKLTIGEFTEDWENDLSSNSIIISAPAVNFFKYRGGFLIDYRFPRSSSIIKASLLFHSYMDKTDIIADHLDEVLRSLQLVKYLKLSHSFFQALSHATTVPILKNLISLEVGDYQLDTTCEELEMVVNKCPCLETLSFLEGIGFYSETDNFNRLSKLKFIYLPSTLKKIVIGNFGGTIKEISFVQILLAKLTSLKTMEIVFLGFEGREEIESILSALSRGSKSCKLKIL